MRQKLEAYRCNICQRSYRRKSRHQRFCRKCRFSEEEMLRFAEWFNTQAVGEVR